MSSPGSIPSAPSPGQRPPRSRVLTKLLWVCSWSYLTLGIGLWTLLNWADLWWPATLFMFAPRWVCLLPLLGFVLLLCWLRRLGPLLPLGLATAIIVGPVMG